MPNRIEPLNTAKAAVAYRRTMGKYSVAIVIWRKHHSVQTARSAPSNVGTSAAGTYAIFSPASRTAWVRMRSSLNTSRHRSSSRSGTRRSFRTAQEPPHANDRSGSNSTFALTAFHSARTRDQNIGCGGRYQRKPDGPVETDVEPANGENRRNGWQERAEGEAHGTSHATAEPDSLDDGRDAREERQDREERQPNPKEVQCHRRANLRVRNKAWRSRTDEDVAPLDAHFERPEPGDRIREVGARSHVILPSVVRARDDRVIEHALPDRAAAVEAHVRDRVESSVDVEQGDGMALYDHDASLPRGKVRRLRDPNERRHQDHEPRPSHEHLRSFMEAHLHWHAGA